MMATEATSENFATTSTTPDHELNTTETASEDVLSEQPLVNGSAEKYGNPQDNTEPVEASINSAEVSVSGGSDTEASKAETSKTQGDEKGHARTASTVKKFASFKPVSVNKTFLAAKSATSVTPSKPGDKTATGSSTPQTGPSTTAAPRPRLVAKTGNGLRDSAPRTSAAINGGKAGAAPDASAVWNKNRPAPPPEPKRFTDEELKQRYGIHLATRLQSDDPGKQANWADIDDDDDDWAPESIEWTDGTKITLPQADEAPPPAPEPTPSPALKETKASEAAKPKSPAPSQSSASPTVRPSVFGSGRAGLVLKGASEKPTLVAKPPGPPTPVKSPWAALPPVAKVAPVAIESAQPLQNRFNQRDPHGFHGMPPPPAKEIAADDFSRSWRDGPPNSSRELYNSQSGRYEPVNDNRGGSVRNDAHSRQPALLHRPPQQDGPAEPSAAFQTHRASGQDGAYGRRRTSSNVSGGSGNFVRRMSRGHDMPPPPHDVLSVRRSSLAALSDAPSSPRTYSPSGQYQNQRGYQNQQWQSRASPVVSHPSPQPTHGQPIPPASSVDEQSQPAIVLQEDPIEAQKKIMRHTRELAIKRRQEEEAREEAARKERIRLKLEAMGPPPESKKNKKETPKMEKVIPTQIQAREVSDAVPQLSKPTGTELSDDSNLKSSESVDEIAAKLGHPDVRSADTHPTNQELRLNGINDVSGQSTTASHQTPQENKSTQSWQQNSTSSDRFHTWAAAPAQQPSSRNVWGPPSNDRTLGNGTFNPELSRLPEMNQSSSNPGPIGPPNSNRGNGQYQQGRGREYGSRPAPIAPPNRQQGPARQDQRMAASGWSTLPERIAQEDAILHQQQESEATRRRELQDAGLAPEVSQPVYKDTWRQVSMNEDGTRSKVQASLTTVNDVQGNSSTWRAEEETTSRPVFEERRLDNVGRHDISQPQFSNDGWRAASNMNASPPIRGSRFFPNNNRDVRLEDQPINFDRPGSPTPPPPTMAGHPAYDGDSVHPHVSLPRPAPVVKLPPAVLAPIGPPKPASFAAALTTSAVPPNNSNYQGRQEYGPRAATSYQDIRREQTAGSGGWQDRISHLLGRKNSPPKSHALAVDSSSKNSLELPASQFTATVSLPSSVSGDLAADDGSVASKPAAEECFEEQEMGSLPVIRVPVVAPRAAWSLASAPPKSLPRKFVVSHVTSADSIHFPQQVTHNGASINILLPGQEELKSISIATTRQRSNPRRVGSRGGNPRHSSSSSHPRGARGRDSSSGFPSPNLDSASISSSPTSRGGHRGNGRGFGSNWSRHVSTPVHT